MSEPDHGVTDDLTEGNEADSEAGSEAGSVPQAPQKEPQEEPQDEPQSVELHLDQEKLEAWDEVKSDYQVEPDGEQ